jgi:hypothetical protein
MRYLFYPSGELLVGFPETEIWSSRPFSGVSRHAMKGDLVTEFQQEREN